MILHIDKEQSSQGPRCHWREKFDLSSPGRPRSLLSTPALREDTAETEKVPGRAEQTNTGGGATSTPRKMKCFVLKGAEEGGEHSLEVEGVMNRNDEWRASRRLPLALSPNRRKRQHLTKLKGSRFRTDERKCSPHNV